MPNTAEPEPVICREFTINGAKLSIHQFLDADDHALLDDFYKNQETIKDRITRGNPQVRGVDDMPYLIAIGRDCPVDLEHEYRGILNMFEDPSGETVTAPLRAFFGEMTARPRRRKSYPLALLNNKVNLDQLLAINNAMRYPLAYVQGPPGTGKTHLAAAIANHLIAQGKPVICMTMIDLLERIKRTYSTTGGSESDVLKIYKTVPLLVIDDIGKEPPTEWAISTVYNIINGRYEAYLPTIVTTNYDTEALIDRMTPRESHDSMTARATIDRLMEMCRGITLTGQSWRSR